MTHYLAELYSPKPAWLALDQDGRLAFFQAINAGMGALSGLGVEPIAMGEIAPDTLCAPAHRFFALWRAPDAAAMQALVTGIAASGWHEYFDTLNATGAGLDLTGHLGQLIAA